MDQQITEQQTMSQENIFKKNDRSGKGKPVILAVVIIAVLVSSVFYALQAGKGKNSTSTSQVSQGKTVKKLPKIPAAYAKAQK